MKSYHWKVSNQDSIFFEDSTGLSHININHLENDFRVNLLLETNIGCLFEDELIVEVGNNCTFQLNKIIYVNANLTNGLQNGTSWENAFMDLQDALNMAEEGDQIWVAKGVYVPTKDRFGIENPLDSESVTFYIDKEVQLFGGFFGGESILEARDWEVNQTILSGDLNGDDEYIQDLENINFPAKD